MASPTAKAEFTFAKQEALTSVRSLRTLLALCLLVPVLLFGLFAAHRYARATPHTRDAHGGGSAGRRRDHNFVTIRACHRGFPGAGGEYKRFS